MNIKSNDWTLFVETIILKEMSEEADKLIKELERMGVMSKDEHQKQ